MFRDGEHGPRCGRAPRRALRAPVEFLNLLAPAEFLNPGHVVLRGAPLRLDGQ